MIEVGVKFFGEEKWNANIPQYLLICLVLQDFSLMLYEYSWDIPRPSNCSHWKHYNEPRYRLNLKEETRNTVIGADNK